MKFKDTKYGDLTNEIFNKNIYYNRRGLKSLEGCPKEVNGFFNCSNNNITSLKWSSNKIDGDFNCNGNKLKNLKYSPEIVNGSFDCGNNKLTSLEGSPEIIGENFICYRNNLKSLKGSPKEVKGNFLCGNNKLETLEFCSKIIGGTFECRFNSNLKNIKSQIIKYQIKAVYYVTDEGRFYFEEIKKDFENYGNNLLKKEQNSKKRLKIIENKKLTNQNDYGLSI